MNASFMPRESPPRPAPQVQQGEPKQAECGYLHCGPNGGGHFVKMVHNGIEYGIMAAYSEGLNIIKSANAGRQSHEVNAETTPLRNPEFYCYELAEYADKLLSAMRYEFGGHIEKSGSEGSP
jgi:6-phosphogluconate dehydrogenase